MIACPRAIAIIGTQDSLVPDSALVLAAVFVVMAFFLRFWVRFLNQLSWILILWESRHGGTAMIVAGDYFAECQATKAGSHSHKGDTSLPIGWRRAP
jgi:hypothetical protein